MVEAMKELIIISEDLKGVVLPDYGGMLAELYYRDRPIFHLDKAMLPNSNVLAGGNPVLFPFPGKTEDDSYEFNGKKYSMPFHGLVKYAQFGVADVREDSVTLCIEQNSVNRKENYPFDYKLEVTYALCGNTAQLAATVHNYSSIPLFHCFGWHPYFTATDKKRFSLTTRMERYRNYADGKIYINKGDADICKPTNYVYDKRTGAETVIDNQADGYRARIVTDDSFDVLVVCTEFDGTVCVEPWLGLPNSINRKDYVKWVDAGQSAVYKTKIEISGCE